MVGMVCRAKATARVAVLEAALQDLNRRYATRNRQTALFVNGLGPHTRARAGRYVAALELVGEKTEEVEELRDDLDEVKVRNAPIALPGGHGGPC